jgi:hypothetical protein
MLIITFSIIFILISAFGIIYVYKSKDKITAFNLNEEYIDKYNKVSDIINNSLDDSEQDINSMRVISSYLNEARDLYRSYQVSNVGRGDKENKTIDLKTLNKAVEILNKCLEEFDPIIKRDKAISDVLGIV